MYTYVTIVFQLTESYTDDGMNIKGIYGLFSVSVTKLYYIIFNNYI